MKEEGQGKREGGVGKGGGKQAFRSTDTTTPGQIEAKRHSALISLRIPSLPSPVPPKTNGAGRIRG